MPFQLLMIAIMISVIASIIVLSIKYEFQSSKTFPITFSILIAIIVFSIFWLVLAGTDTRTYSYTDVPVQECITSDGFVRQFIVIDNHQVDINKEFGVVIKDKTIDVTRRDFYNKGLRFDQDLNDGYSKQFITIAKHK